MLALYGLLLIFIWMTLAQGLPDVIDDIRERRKKTFPPIWAFAVAAVLLWGLSYFHSTESPEAKSQEALKEVITHIDRRDYKKAISLLEDIAFHPPWVPKEPLDEPRPPGPF